MRSRQPAGPGSVNQPGLVDIQVNGHAGVDFNNDDWTHDQLHTMLTALRGEGVAGIFATVITAPAEVMLARVQRVIAAIESDRSVSELIWGIHVEGPFLNPNSGYIGAHPPASATDANLDFIQQMRDVAGPHLKLWTLAPERDQDCRATRLLSDAGVIVAAGHSDASLDQLDRAIDHGLHLYTHLGNGCPGMLPRHDNIINRVLSVADRLFVSFIADGHHVPWFALANYLRLMPPEHVIIVSDSMSAAGMGPGRYRLGGQWVEVDPDLSAWAEGREHFAGSATSLAQMRTLLRQHLQIDDDQLTRWTQDNPRRLIATRSGDTCHASDS